MAEEAVYHCTLYIPARVDVVAAEVRKVKENVKLVNDTFKHFRAKGFLQIILTLLLITT